MLTAPRIGWSATYTLIGALAALSCLVLPAGLPKGLKRAPVVFATWRRSGRSRALVLLLLITTLLAVGQSVVIAIAGALLIRLTDATPGKIVAAFALFR